jgi:hypothetical protein
MPSAPVAPDSAWHPPRATRRGFLRLASTTAALAALAQLRAIPIALAAEERAGDGGFFQPGDREILTQIAERMVDTGEAGAPRVRETRTVASIDALCRRLDPSISGQLPWALRAFEYGPFVFDLTPKRFTRMSDAEKDASLEAWMTSRLAVRRLAFVALRNLSMLGYYSQPETWPLIGYMGPLVGPGPRA